MNYVAISQMICFEINSRTIDTDTLYLQWLNLKNIEK